MKGYYNFRVVGVDDKGEFRVETSSTYRIETTDQLIARKQAFLEFCKTEYKILNPKITHTNKVEGDIWYF